MNETAEVPIDQKTQEEQYPRVAEAQAFVIPSYTWMLSRVEAADSRLHTLTAFVATVTLAIPATSRAINTNLSFASGWFVLAAVLSAIAVGVGIFARVRGVLHIASPTRLFESTLHLSEWEFQRNTLQCAGDAFDHNRKLVETKSDAVTAMGALFVIELVALLLWVARG